MGPLLFIMFYNDFTEHVDHTEVIMYSDDIVMFYADKDRKLIEKLLNEDMKTIHNYCTENELIVNTKKRKNRGHHGGKN